MLARLFRRALVAFIIYYCVMSIFQWSPWLTCKIEPHLHGVLTESIDFIKVRTVMLDLFFHPSELELYHDQRGILKGAGRDKL